MQTEDFEKLLEKVADGEAGPEDVSRLKQAVEENPELRERWQASSEACAIVRGAGRFTPIKDLTIPPIPLHRKAEFLAAVRQIPINTMEPGDLLNTFGCFAHAQALGKILGYDPEIKTSRLTMKLSEWKIDKTGRTEGEDLENWTRQKPGFDTMVRKLIDAAEPSWKHPLWSSKYDYRKVLLEIREHLKLPGYPTESFADIETQILDKLMEIVLEKYSKMPPEKQAKFRKSIEEQLHNQGKTLGELSLEQVLLAGGGAGLVSALGAQLAAGIILAHLGLSHAILLGLGLYAVPVGLIGGAIFAPIAAGFIGYYAGRHNYRKTIPAVVTLAALRQQRIDASARSSRK